MTGNVELFVAHASVLFGLITILLYYYFSSLYPLFLRVFVLKIYSIDKLVDRQAAYLRQRMTFHNP